MKSIFKKSLVPFSILCAFLMVLTTSFQPVAATETQIIEKYKEKIEEIYALENTIDPDDNPDWLPWFPGKIILSVFLAIGHFLSVITDNCHGRLLSILLALWMPGAFLP
jgi:hypothetical protein